MLFLLAFALGMTAGLRSLTPPAIVAWAAQARWPALRLSPLAFMGAPLTVWIMGVLAGIELVADKLPFTPSRLAPPPLLARIVLGALCGATLFAASTESWVVGAVVGALGGLAGSFAGYHIRRFLVTRHKHPDLLIAVVEDAVTIAGAFFVVSQV